MAKGCLFCHGFGKRLPKTNRYSCSGDNLSFSHLARLADGYPALPRPRRINRVAAESMRGDDVYYVDRF